MSSFDYVEKVKRMRRIGNNKKHSIRKRWRTSFLEFQKKWRNRLNRRFVKDQLIHGDENPQDKIRHGEWI